MVGKQHPLVGAVADVRDQSEAGASGERRCAPGDEHGARQLRARAIVSHTTMSYPPPPKSKRNNIPQRHDIAGELAEPRAALASWSERSRESVSASGAVGTHALASAHLRRGVANCRAADHSHGRAGDAARWLAQLAPAALPPGVELTVNDEHSKWYRLRLAATPLRATLEIEIWQGELWAHLTISGRTSPPSLPELGFCRDLFLGDRKAIQVLPRKLEQAEAGASTVHLYAPLESDALPSFSRAYQRSFPEV